MSGRANVIASQLGPKKKFTKAEVAQHKTEKDCWIIIGKLVIDVTKFIEDHPGGKKPIMMVAGRDGTEEFDSLHDRKVIEKYVKDCIVGELA